MIRYLSTPFIHPQATLWALSDPIYDLSKNIMELPHIQNGRLSIHSQNLQTIFRRLTCERSQQEIDGLIWSNKKIILLITSTLSMGLSYITTWSFTIPIGLYVGYRTYKVFLTRQLLDLNINPSLLRHYPSASESLLKERVPGITALCDSFLTGKAAGLMRYAAPEASVADPVDRLTLSFSDHTQITALAPALLNLLRESPTSLHLQADGLSMLEGINPLERTLFCSRIIPLLSAFTTRRERFEVFQIICRDINPSDLLEYLNSITPLLDQLSNDYPRFQLIRNFSNQKKASWPQWTVWMHNLFQSAGDNQAVKKRINGWMETLILLPNNTSHRENLASCWHNAIEGGLITDPTLDQPPGMILQNLFQDDPELRKLTVRCLSDRLSQITHARTARSLARQINDYKEALISSNQKDPLLILAGAIWTWSTELNLLISTDPRNPYELHRRLIASAQSHPNLESPWTRIEGIRARFDVANMRQNGRQTILRAELLHKLEGNQIPPKGLTTLALQMKRRIDTMDRGAQEITTSFGNYADFDTLCTNLQDPFFSSLLTLPLTEEVPFQQAYAFAVLAHILALSNDPIGEGILSPQEEALLTFSSSLLACRTGKSEGLVLFYNALDPRYRYSTATALEAAIDTMQHYMREQVQSQMRNLFSNDNAMMRQMNENQPVQQLSHQSNYIKNFLGIHLGLDHTLNFDVYTIWTLTGAFIRKNLPELADVFFRHFTVEDLILKLQEYYRTRPNPTLFNQSVAWLDLRGEDLTESWSCETDPPIPTSRGALSILQKSGIVTLME
ncbi:MAG: hypothetical protein NTZ52_05630 [Chlamydiae bacterium]|nr:hypothetical protein [Chlamydiota bacterium]